MSDEKRSVRLPARLCEQIEKRLAAQRGGLEAFLTFAMREMLRDEATEMDQAEQRVIEQRLKDLGYL